MHVDEKEKLSADYHALNAALNLYGADGKLQLAEDRKAVRSYFLNHVNQNTVFFHNLREKLNYLLANEYYDPDVLDQYSYNDVKELFKQAYSHKFRFPTFLGAYKFFTSYALKNFDGDRYLERYEDRVCMVALALARGDVELAKSLVDEIISGRFQPATPTFLNAGKAQRGDLVSCFLLRTEDDMFSISRSLNSVLQLSKRGGGVAILLTNLREQGAPIKRIKGQSSGILGPMKLCEDAASYANQLGARQGACAVYLHAHHPDILKFLDTKRENADEKVRIKTLSLGVVIPDVTFDLARKNAPMYLFSPYDVERVYGKPFSDISVTELYDEMVANPEITKTKINAREFFQTLAEVQFESGYPYILFEDTANRACPVEGKVNMSNLCSEILQTNTPSEFNPDLTFKHVGEDISCNLGSLNIAETMASPDVGKTVDTAIRALTSVSEQSTNETVPSVAKANANGHAIGLGQMNLHGFLGANRIHYGSQESIDFTSTYFAMIAYYAVKASNELAKEKGRAFVGFEQSSYASGEYFTKYIHQDWSPKTEQVKDLFDQFDVKPPTKQEWADLADSVKKFGLYNKHLQAVPPTGSISYINNATASIHPIAAPIEIRKEGKIGRVYFPAPGLTNDNLEYFQDAYEVGYEKLIDVYAAATEHVDQGLSLTLFLKDTATTRDVNKAQIYAFKKGIKTIYYLRLRQQALEGTDVEECVSCTL